MVIWARAQDDAGAPRRPDPPRQGARRGAGPLDEEPDRRGAGEHAPSSGAPDGRLALRVWSREAGFHARRGPLREGAAARGPQGLGMILDTNAVSGLLEGHPTLEALLAREVRHELPVIVIGEYR